MESTETTALAMTESEKSLFMGRTYGWMGLALFISAVTAFFTSRSIFSANGLTTLGKFLFGNGMVGFFVLVISEIVLVFWLSHSIRKISVQTATIGFIAYSVINGITLSSIFIVYRISSIAAAFFGCSAMFLALCFYGTTTKRNLLSFGKYLMMGLIGIVIASLAQMVIGFFTKTPLTMLDFLISVATIIVFTGLTAYDAQKIIRTAEQATGSDDYKKVSILGALELYLDFINLFLALLRLFGKRR
ncbi:MAG: Bax inhibitor-1/YccA family protein [Treponema sp.]|nr:Bax inhibitor-1/YccA family protein [Treponema sp.]